MAGIDLDTQLVIERGAVVPFDGLPPRSIALDGYVAGPEIDPSRRRFSFDHHSHCVRLATTATCRQVADALRLGLDPGDCTVYINDVDGDTALAVWLLIHPSRVGEPDVADLVDAVANVDAHGPAYPPDRRGWGRAFFSGAMASEIAARAGGSYATCDLRELLAKCLDGIERLLSTGPQEADGGEPWVEVTRSGTGWILAHAGPDGFDAVYRAGWDRAVIWSVQPDGSYAYTVGRRSDLVDRFPVGPVERPGTILAALASVEPGWGGGSSIGGAPRHADGRRSSLKPAEVFAIVEGVVSALG